MSDLNAVPDRFAAPETTSHHDTSHIHSDRLVDSPPVSHRPEHHALDQQNPHSAATGLFIVADAALHCVEIDTATAACLGSTPQILAGRPLVELVPELVAVCEPAIRRVFETGQPVSNVDVEAPSLVRAGATVCWRLAFFPCPLPEGNRGIAITGTDITELVRGMAALGERESRLAEALNSIAEGYYALDSGWRFIAANRRAEAHFGRSFGELQGQNIWEITEISPDSELYRRFHQAVATQETVRFEARSYIRPDYWAQMHLRPKQDGLEVYFTNISARKRAEEALRESDRRLRMAMELGTIGLYETDVQAAMATYDATARKVWGFPQATVPLTQVYARIHPDDRERVANAVARSQDPNLRTLYAVEFRCVRDDGSIGWIDARGGYLFDESCTPPVAVRAIGVMTDVTERKLLAEQLAQSQKMESIGRLAGGVAHDFNNLLTAIAGYTDLTRESLPPDDPIHANIDQIDRAAGRAAELTRQLLAFARKQIIAPRETDLNTLILHSQKMLARLIGEDIVVQTRICPDLWAIKIDPGQMEQALINLAVNARDAMPTGGTLIMETQNVALNAETVRRQDVEMAPGEYVRLSVRDNGIGMPPEIASRVFEPFFTTKEVGKGTGLGLAMVHGILRQNGGYIHINSEPGRGTTFALYFPRVESIAIPETTLRDHRAPQGSETVLLIEDEALVRGMAALALRTKGYTVIEASNGSEGLKIVEEQSRPIDLVITDVVMPDVSGRVVVEKVRKTRPEAKILYVSGYAENVIAHHGVLEPGTAFLPKPFTPTILARTVRQVLDGAS